MNRLVFLGVCVFFCYPNTLFSGYSQGGLGTAENPFWIKNVDDEGNGTFLLRGQTESFSSIVVDGSLFESYFIRQISIEYELFSDLFGDLQERGQKGESNFFGRLRHLDMIYGVYCLDSIDCVESRIKEFPQYHLAPNIPQNQTSSSFCLVRNIVSSEMSFAPGTCTGEISASASIDHGASANPNVVRELDAIGYGLVFWWDDPSYNENDDNDSDEGGGWKWNGNILREQPLTPTAGVYSYTASSESDNDTPVANPPLVGTKLDWVFDFFPVLPEDVFLWSQLHPDPIPPGIAVWGQEYIFGDGFN